MREPSGTVQPPLTVQGRRGPRHEVQPSLRRLELSYHSLLIMWVHRHSQQGRRTPTGGGTAYTNRGKG